MADLEPSSRREPDGVNCALWLQPPPQRPNRTVKAAPPGALGAREAAAVRERRGFREMSQYHDKKTRS